MAGDLPFEEVLVVHGDFGAAATEGALVESPAPSGRVLQRFGDRVEIRLGAGDGTGAVVPEISEAVLESLTVTERFGVEALQLRASPEFRDAKANRPREGEVWDMPGCGPTEAAGLRAEPFGAEAGAPAPTSDYLLGSVALGVVIVNGPTAATQFTAAEQTKIVAEVQAGAAWLAGFNPLGRRELLLRRAGREHHDAAQRHGNRQREPIPQSGRGRAWLPGQLERRRRLRQLAARQPAHELDLLRLLRQGLPAWTISRTRRSAARASSWSTPTTAGARTTSTACSRTRPATSSARPDEYASSGCNCGGAWGRFGEPNANCENCAGAAGVGCLMRANDWLMCGSTKRHFGWGLTSLRTHQPSMCNVVSRSTDHLDVFVTDGGGDTSTAAWEPAMVSWWEGWWDLLGGRAAPGAPVTVVSRRPDFIDAFVVGTDGHAYTCAWAPGQGWRGWWRIGNAVFPQGAMINAVSRSQDHLDIFATDASGRVLTAAWEPAFTDGWHGWWEIRGGRARPGAPVTAVSRSANKLDIFVIGTDGGCLYRGVGAGVHRRLARLVADRQRDVPAGLLHRRGVAQCRPPRRVRDRHEREHPHRRLGARVQRRLARLVAHPRRPGAAGRTGQRRLAEHEQARRVRDRDRQRDLHGGLGAGVHRRLARLVEPQRRQGRARVVRHRRQPAAGLPGRVRHRARRPRLLRGVEPGRAVGRAGGRWASRRCCPAGGRLSTPPAGHLARAPLRRRASDTVVCRDPMGRLRIFLSLAGLFAALPAAAGAQGRVEPVAGLVDEADAIVAGPDGAMWASLGADPGRIARITTAGAVVYAGAGGFAGFPANRHPSGLARSGGALWFRLSGGPETFARLRLGYPVSAFSLAHGRPTSLAGGPDGALWMTVDGGPGQPDAITRFTTDPPGELTRTLAGESDPRSIVAGPDGALWFVEGGRLGRITTSGALTYRSVGAAPAALAAGPPGTLWYAQGGTVRRLDDAAEYATGSPVTALAAGPDGAVWAAVRGGVARIVPGEDPTTLTASTRPRTPERSPRVPTAACG